MKSKLKKYERHIQVLVLLGLGFFFYLVLGQEWISIQDDSMLYLEPRVYEGVMPIYPLFIFSLKVMFRENAYLVALVVAQSLLAIFCTLIFTLYLRRIFHLRFWETILIYLCCMLPFSIYLPESGITHQIMTEGITYALFYVYFVFLLQYVLSKKSIWLLWVTVMAFVLALTRSQLLFLFIAIGIAFAYVQMEKSRTISKTKKALIGITSLFCGAVATLVLVMLVYKVYGLYLTYQLPTMINWGQERVEEVIDNVVSEPIIVKKKETTETMSQFTTLVMTRGFYEVDESDIELFELPEMKEIFMKVYKAVDEEKYRYVYARQDLYMWKDLICDKIPFIAFTEIENYLQENPQIDLEPKEAVRELGTKVLFHHFDRYIYHTLRMMVSGFISSVFFQIESIYLLCHIITLGLFLFAIIAGWYCNKINRSNIISTFTVVTVGSIVLQVVIVNVMFFGLQRYMVYVMGIFYCCIYILLKDICLILVEKFKNIKDASLGDKTRR